MKKINIIFLAAMLSLPLGILNAEDAPAKKVPQEVLEKPYLYELTRYLYRWYLDETDIESIADKKDMEFKIRVMDVKLDEGDKSQYVEVFIPELKLSVKLKKSDYMIEELKAEVKSNGFKVDNVSRYAKDFEIPKECMSIEIDMKEMRAYLFKTRNDAAFPSPELYARIKKAFHEEFKDELLKKLPAENIKKEWVTFVAPLSPVANEFWAFWENGKYLVRCSSDIDLTNSDVWEHESLSFKIYDTLNQMVVSLGETAGDNSFMTRDQIGRALYNCVVLGHRIIVRPQILPPEQEEKGKK
ncbi:MAG TPA: hypothetical protein DCZ94_11210 [Lentisphaeria bacterium]|nr:MAG: hypothetical protein A2X48_07090 [Lentisphaerae bacterium GWF2_49_21]HBC87514.1 hypothetical protein [Lentisphaeria bacterium]